jgi:hypothetical protein
MTGEPAIQANFFLASPPTQLGRTEIKEVKADWLLELVCELVSEEHPRDVSLDAFDAIRKLAVCGCTPQQFNNASRFRDFLCVQGRLFCNRYHFNTVPFLNRGACM